MSVLKRGWQLVSPYTDLCRPKRMRVILEGPGHVFNPQELVDDTQLKVYRAYKRNINGELRDIDLLEPVDAVWFHRLQTNFMDVDDQSFLEHQYRKMIPRNSRGQITPSRWNVLRSWWKDDDLTTVLGGAPIGCRLWHEVDMVLIPCNIGRQHWLLVTVDLICGKLFIVDPWRQEVKPRILKQQVAPLRYFVPLMLYQAEFHTKRATGLLKFEKISKPFDVTVVSDKHIPQQKQSGNCGPHTLKLIEYILANKKDFDWSEDDMRIIREKMAVEIFVNSRPI
ncbi:hypothetical protein Ddye_005676 [Dipteronia dyeriana]|uniref:Ubiquitin-like protease family profile domain-containing protein n=1 Tax=Dipteronia dyeriana TaxID=168575 RepID=A0AAE0CQH1_9ROSI|nr:hypothetical protein Ddye_005676 [Dipteronia dyeriana]